MLLHASCAAWLGPDGYDSVLLLGPPGAGKSDFLLRLLDQGFVIVADDQVQVEDGIARAPSALVGMIEVRGLGIFKLDYVPAAPLRLAVQLERAEIRLPEPVIFAPLNLPLVTIDPQTQSAVARVKLALEAACGRVQSVSGAFCL